MKTATLIFFHLYYGANLFYNKTVYFVLYFTLESPIIHKMFIKNSYNIHRLVKFLLLYENNLQICE